MVMSLLIPAWQRVPAALQLLLFTLTVYAVGLLSVEVFRPSGSTLAVWWPAAGVGLVALLLASASQRWWVLGAHLIATFAINATGGQELRVAVLLGFANAIELFAIVWLLERGGRDPRQMHGPEDLWRFVLAVCVGAVLVAVLAALVVSVAYGNPVWPTVRSIAPSHLSALLLFGLLPMRQLPSQAEAGRAEVAGQWVLVCAVMLLVFAPGQRIPLVFMTVPVLLWAALRSGVRVLAGQLVAAAGLAAVMTLRGGGPFTATGATGGVPTVQDAVALVQLFAATLALVMLTAFLVVQSRREAAARIARRDRRLRLVQEQGLTGVVELQVVEGGLSVVSANRIAARFLEGTHRKSSTTLWCELFVDADRQQLRAGLHGLLADELDTWHGELEADTEDAPRWFEVALFLDPDREGPTQLVAQMLDVTARRTNEIRLRDLALQDPLTGLANRTLFFDRLHHALASAPRTAGRVGLIVLDLDGFKPINDRYGHQAGDTILIEIARRLERGVRSGDTVARLGGDEFAIVLGQLTDAAGAETAVARLRRELREPIALPRGNSAKIGISIGMVTSPGTDDPHYLLHQADVAMYAEKRQTAPQTASVGAGDR